MYLANVLTAIATSELTLMDCYALSDFLNILAYSIGFPYYNSAVIRLTPTYDPKINTNYIRPAHFTSDVAYTEALGNAWPSHQIISFRDIDGYEYIADPSAQVYRNSTLTLAKGDIDYDTYIPLLTLTGITRGARNQTIISN